MTVAAIDFRSLLNLTPINQPYWDGLREGRLTFQACRSCGQRWLPAREQCPRCLGDDTVWELASGRGRLVSWVVYHIAPNRAFQSRLPYNVALVELDEGPRLITNLVDFESGSAPHIEAPVEVVIEEEGGLAMARFRFL